MKVRISSGMENYKHLYKYKIIILCSLVAIFLIGCIEKESDSEIQNELYEDEEQCEQENELNLNEEKSNKNELNLNEEKSDKNELKLIENDEEGIYTYQSGQMMICMEQAVDLVVEIIERKSKIRPQRVQNSELYQYQMNPRIIKEGSIHYLTLQEWEQYLEQKKGELGEQLLINKIECRVSEQEAIQEGYYQVIIYEDIIDDIENGEGHQAITCYYAVDWVEQIVVKDYYWNDWYMDMINNRELYSN